MLKFPPSNRNDLDNFPTQTIKICLHRFQLIKILITEMSPQNFPAQPVTQCATTNFMTWLGGVWMLVCGIEYGKQVRKWLHGSFCIAIFNLHYFFFC